MEDNVASSCYKCRNWDSHVYYLTRHLHHKTVYLPGFLPPEEAFLYEITLLSLKTAISGPVVFLCTHNSAEKICSVDQIMPEESLSWFVKATAFLKHSGQFTQNLSLGLDIPGGRQSSHKIETFSADLRECIFQVFSSLVNWKARIKSMRRISLWMTGIMLAFECFLCKVNECSWKCERIWKSRSRSLRIISYPQM